MAPPLSSVYSSSLNDWRDSTETLTNTQPMEMDEHAHDCHPLHNEEKSSIGTHASGCQDPSGVNGSQDSRQSQAAFKAAELEEFKSSLSFTKDKILVCLNLKGKMVVKDYLIDQDMLQSFEERYGEGDCLHLAKLYYQERDDGKAFVDYMTKIADQQGLPQFLRGEQPRRLQFASYWIGWDAQKNDRFRKPGPCIGDHIVLRGATPTKSELQFMREVNISPKFDRKMIIERTDETDIPIHYPYEVKNSRDSWDGYLDWLFAPEDWSDRKYNNANAFNTLQTVSRLREVFDNLSQSSPSQVSMNNPEGEDYPLSASWISMNHQERRKHLEETKSKRESKQAKIGSQTFHRSYWQSSEPRSQSKILSYGQDHSARMLSHRKHNA